MRILYVARHGHHDNSDEDAIGWALEQLGHEVTRVPEAYGNAAFCVGFQEPYDLLLCHKWYDFATLSQAKARVKAFWFFDLVTSDDWDLKDRNAERVKWITGITPLVDLGFCTDGDWVARDTTGKLHWLMQGMDERVAGPGQRPPGGWCGTGKPIDILFAGSTIHGGRRISHIRDLQARYGLFGNRFVCFGHKPRERRHGRELADVFASAKIVIAPDGPCSDHYWSNRVYLTLGLGGFLLHPYCRGLEEQYAPRELATYHDRQMCFDMIDWFLERPDWRQRIARAGYERTLRDHTYRQRCRQLIYEVEALLRSPLSMEEKL